jgi:hypothetical protein
MALTLKHQTAAQFAARLRERYRNAEREDAAKIARWVARRLAAGDITDAQMRAAFGLTTTQWSNLKARMQTLAANYDAVLSARGE